jgi:thiol-disulfide isomerase/thioredoxin
MRPRVRCLALVAAAFLANAVALDAVADDRAPVGEQEREFVAIDTFNMRPTKNPLKSLKGRVVLFVMFQTWYQKCAEAVNDLNALHDKYGPKGMTLLACGEQDRKTVEPWIAEKGVKFAWALIDTPTGELFKKDWPTAGYPHSFLIDATGRIAWQGHPQMIPPGTIEPLLKGTTQAPLLPKSLEAQQKLLDDGQWAAAKKSLEAFAAEGKGDKADVGWAKGTAEWIQQRYELWFPDAEALVKQGLWWDAWKMLDEFPRRFEGMDGADKAKARAEEIRKTPEAEKDLRQGDDVAKARELVAKKNWNPAKLILTRILKEAKGTRHADRAQELVEQVPAKQ